MKNLFPRIVACALIPLVISADPVWAGGMANLLQPMKPVASSAIALKSISTLLESEALQQRLGVAYRGFQPAIQICRQLSGPAVGLYALGKAAPAIVDRMPAITHALHVLSGHIGYAFLAGWGLGMVALTIAMRFSHAASASHSTGLTRNIFIKIAAVGIATAGEASAQERKPPEAPLGVKQDLEVPNLVNLPHSWIQGDPPTKPVETVDDVIELALRRHLLISSSWDAIVKKRNELRLDLMPRSTLVFGNDKNHPGPAAALGSSGLNFGLADLLVNGTYHRDNSPNRVDTFSENPRLSQRILDAFMGGVEFHPKSEQALYEANRLKVLAEFRAEYGKGVEVTAEQVIQDLVGLFFKIADIDIQNHYKTLEIENWKRAVDFYIAEEDSGANHGFLPGAQHAKSVAEQQLRTLQADRKQTEIKFYEHFSQQDKEALMKAGGIRPRWSAGAVEPPAKPIPVISNQAFWEHLVTYYELDRRVRNPTVLPPPRAQPKATPKRGAKPAAVPIPNPAPAQPSLMPLNWGSVSMMLEQKGFFSRAAKVKELAALNPEGLDFSDPRIFALYNQITFPVPSDKPGDVPASLASASPDQLLGDRTQIADKSSPEASSVQRHLVMKDDLAKSLSKVYDAKEKNLTQVGFSVLGVLASILNVRIQPALYVKIGTKDEKRVLKQLRTINASDQDLIKDGIEADQQSEKTRWESFQLDDVTKRNNIVKKWGSIGTQISLLEKELARKREGEPELNAQVLNVQSEVQVIEQAQLEATKAQVELALRSGLRKQILFDLAGIAQNAANIDFEKEKAKQLQEKAAEEAARQKKKDARRRPNPLLGFGVSAALFGIKKLDDGSNFGGAPSRAAIVEPLNDISSVLHAIWHFASVGFGWVGHIASAVHSGLSRALSPISDWLLYSPIAPALGIVILTVSAAYLFSSFFKVKLPKGLGWGYTFLAGLFAAHALPFGGLQQAGIAIALGIALQLIMPSRKYSDGSLGAEAITLSQFGRRFWIKGAIFSGSLFTMEFLARWFDPKFEQQQQKFRDARRKLSVESGQVGIWESEFNHEYTPPKGTAGKVIKVQWPEPEENPAGKVATIRKNQAIVFWTASKAVRTQAAKIGVTLPEPPPDAIIVVERTDSLFDTKLLDLVREYETHQRALAAFKNRNDGNQKESWQEHYEQAYLAIIRRQALAIGEEAEQMNWTASEPVQFDPERVANPMNLDVGPATKLPLFSKPYQRLQFSFTKEQAFYFATFWSDPDVYLSLSNGQKIHLTQIIGIEEDKQYSSVQSKMLDPYFTHLFADLQPVDSDDQSIFIKIPKDDPLTFDGFFSDDPKRDLSQEIPKLGTDSFIGFITSKYDSPVESRSAPYQAALQKEAAVLTQGAQTLQDILDNEAKTHEGGLGRTDMRTGASTSIAEREARRSDPENLRTRAGEVTAREGALATAGVDFSPLTGQVAATDAGGKRIYAAHPGDWLNSSFTAPGDFAHNASHSEWKRMDRDKPLFDVSLLMPTAQALSDGDEVQVILPRGQHKLAGMARNSSHKPQDSNIPQQIQIFELPFHQEDYVSQFPEAASPHSGLVIVQKVKSAPPATGGQDKKAAPVRSRPAANLLRRDLFIPSGFAGKSRTMLFLSAVLSTFAFGLDKNPPPAHNTTLVFVFTALLEAGLLFFAWEAAVAGFRHLSLLASKNLNGFSEGRRIEPGTREFQEAPTLRGEPVHMDVGQEHTRLADQSRISLYENLPKLLPNEVRSRWTSHLGEWMANKSLTWVQRLLWPLGLVGKKSFRIHRYRLLYSNYESYNVSLWQSWLIWFTDYFYATRKWAESKIVHYAGMLLLYTSIFSFLYWGLPFVLVYFNFSMEGSTPLVSWLIPLVTPSANDTVRILINLIVTGVLWTLLKPFGEGIPIYLWLAIVSAVRALNVGMAYDFKKKTNVEKKVALAEVNAAPLNNNETLSSAEFVDEMAQLDELAQELQWGLLRVLPNCSADVQQEVAESFYEYDRHVRSRNWPSRIDNIALDLPPDENPETGERPQMRDAAAIVEQRRRHVQNIFEMLHENRHPRGVLFALIAGDVSDLALDGLGDVERARTLAPLIQIITGRTRSWVRGLFDLYGENYRHHQIFRNIHIINDKITDPTTSPEEKEGLKQKFLILTAGDSQFQALVEAAFSKSRKIGGLLVRTVSFVVVRTWSRWAKNNVEPIDTSIGKLQHIREPGIRDYFNDEYLRGGDGSPRTNTARLLMGQRHGDELAETLMEFGIALFPKTRRRRLYYGTALFANLREAVRLLLTLTWLVRSRVYAHSSSVRTDGIVDQLMDRIPPRLPFLGSLRLRPLYSNQWSMNTDAAPGHEPVVLFSYEQADIQRNLGWRQSLGILSPAPHLATLGLLLMAVLQEETWLRAAIRNRREKYANDPVKLERLAWLEANLFTVGSYLESLGIGWSYNRFMPDNIHELTVKKAPADDPDNNGRWDGMHLFGPDAAFNSAHPAVPAPPAGELPGAAKGAA